MQQPPLLHSRSQKEASLTQQWEREGERERGRERERGGRERDRDGEGTREVMRSTDSERKGERREEQKW